MKTGTAFATTLFALASFPLLAQEPPPANQPPPPSPAAPVMETSPVTGELVSKLDSKTAKTGDSVVVQIKTSVKTPDGTEIPKGSKLVGHVMGVHPSAAGDNAQVALQFDHVELKGGQSVPVYSQIQSISPAGGTASASSGAVAPQTAGSNPGVSGANGGARASGDAGAAPAGNSPPAAGTIVARTGNIAIRATSIPGVLVANNAPGQQDQRMGQSSGILLGAKQDIELEGGTQMVLGVAGTGGGTR